MKKRSLTIRKFFSYALIVSFVLFAPQTTKADTQFTQSIFGAVIENIVELKRETQDFQGDIQGKVKSALLNFSFGVSSVSEKISDKITNSSKALVQTSASVSEEISKHVGDVKELATDVIQTTVATVGGSITESSNKATQLASVQSASVTSALNGGLEKVYGFAIDKTANVLIPFFIRKEPIQTPALTIQNFSTTSPKKVQPQIQNQNQVTIASTTAVKKVPTVRTPSTVSGSTVNDILVQNILKRLTNLENRNVVSGPIQQFITNTYTGGTSYSVPADTTSYTNAIVNSTVNTAVASLQEQISFISSSGNATNTFAFILATSTSATSTFAGNMNVGGNVEVGGRITAAAFYGDGSNLTGISSGSSFSTSTTRGVFSSTASGLTYNNSTGDFSLTSGYNIPLAASTTEWATSIATVAGLSSSVSTLNASTTNLSASAALLTASTTNLSSFWNTPSTRIAAGTGLSWSGNTLNSTTVSSQWATNGANISYVAGNVGIGTADPQALFTVGDYTGSDLIVDPANYFIGLGNSNPINQEVEGIAIFEPNADGVKVIKIGSDGLTGNTTKFTVDDVNTKFTFTGGNVGIGTANPGASLHIYDGSFKVESGSGSAFSVSDDLAGVVAGIHIDNGSARFSNGNFTIDQNGNSYIAGNLGIGTTTPSSKLSVVGDINTTGALKFNDNAGVSGYVLQSTGTGAQWVATSTLGISGGGISSQWTSSSTNIFYSTGNVGIGVASPSDRLAVLGNIYTSSGLSVGGGSASTTGTRLSLTPGNISSFSSSESFARWTIGNSAVTNGVSSLVFDSSASGVNAGGGAIGQPVSQTLAFYTSNGSSLLERMRLNSAGSLGIGTTSPSARLAITGAAGAGDIFAIASSTDARLLTFTSTGRLGIGTTSPAASLDVAGTYGAQLFVGQSGQAGNISFRRGSDGATAANIGYSGATEGGQFNITSGGGSGAISLIATGGSVTVNAANAFHSVFHSNGNFGIGTSTPSSRLTIVGSSGSGADLFNVASSTNASLFRIASTGATYFNNSAGTAGMVLLSNGTGSSPTWVATSSLGIGGGAGSGIVNSGLAGQVAFYNADGTSVSGTSTLFLANGNVGIGTSTPSAQLAITGVGTTTGRAFAIGNSSNADRFVVTDAGNVNMGTTLTSIVSGTFNIVSQTGNISISPGSGGATYLNQQGLRLSDGTQGLSRPAVNEMSILTNGAERMRFNSAGDVGIGTTSPSARLAITGTAGAGDIFAIASSTQSRLFTISNIGNVAIGSATSSALFSVSGSNSANEVEYMRFNSINSASSSDEMSTNWYAGNSSIRLAKMSVFNEGSSKAGFRFGTTNNGGLSVINRMILSGDGYLGVGTGTAPLATLHLSRTNTIAGVESELMRYTLTGNSSINDEISTYWYTQGTSHRLAKMSVINEGSGRAGFRFGTTNDGAVTTPNRVAITGDGRLGVGLVNPASNLSVLGNVSIGSGFATVAAPTNGILVEGQIGAGSSPDNNARLTLRSIASAGPTAIWQTFKDSGGVTKWGISEFSTGDMNFYEAGVADARFYLKAGGNVGIGTTSPSARLAITGTAGTGDIFNVASSTNASLFRIASTGATYFNNSAGTAGMVLLSNGTGSSPTWVATSSLGIAGGGSLSGGVSGYLARWTSASTLSTGLLLDNGTVSGINATSTLYTFNLQGSSGVNPFNVASSTGASLFAILQNGNVGIGTTTPWARLTVAGEAAATHFTAASTTATSTFPGGLSVGGGALVHDWSSGLTTISNAALGAMTFDSDSGMVSWIDMPVTSASASGTVQSYSAQLDGTPALTVYGLSDGAGAVNTIRLGVGTSTPTQALSVVGTINATSLLGGSTNLTVDANGNIIRDPSDQELKENIVTLEGSLAKIAQLRGVRYEWKDKERFGTSTEIGVIAQEVEMVVPEVVSSGGLYKSVNIKNLVALLIEGVKELKVKVDAITAWFGTDGDRFNVKGMVCVDDVCVSKEQFKQMLINSGSVMTVPQQAPVPSPTPELNTSSTTSSNSGSTSGSESTSGGNTDEGGTSSNPDPEGTSVIPPVAPIETPPAPESAPSPTPEAAPAPVE